MLKVLESIPANIWSVVLGSIIAFGGVLISDRSQSKRLKIQLKHDSELKAIERKAVMRREVYLNAAEELVKANSYLGSLPQLDLIKTNIANGLLGFSVASAKLGLVAEEETAKALNELVIAYNGLVLKLVANVIPIGEQRIQINIKNVHYDESQTEIKRILAEMSRQNESGAPDGNIFKSLNSSFEFHQTKAKKLNDERNECWNKVNELTKQFILLLSDEMKEIALLQVPVMVGIRKELDIDTNIESYKELINKSTERIREQLDNFLVSIKSIR
ncbi:MAG: hypothetical protein NT145_05265 [Elusimicrobia bacterium]|nr:hypothetical protein [Elusimicrobiota bacterium]